MVWLVVGYLKDTNAGEWYLAKVQLDSTARFGRHKGKRSLRIDPQQLVFRHALASGGRYLVVNGTELTNGGSCLLLQYRHGVAADR